jgi:hypothetical protein
VPVKGYPYWDCMGGTGRLCVYGQECQPGGRLALSAGPVPCGSVSLCGLARLGPGGRCLAVRHVLLSEKDSHDHASARRLAVLERLCLDALPTSSSVKMISDPLDD